MAYPETLRIIEELGQERTAALIERMAGLIMRVSDGVRDEGDRAYLRSTNDAEELKALTQEWFEMRYVDAEVSA